MGQPNTPQSDYASRSHHEWVQYLANIITLLTGIGSVVGVALGQPLLVIGAVAALIFMIVALAKHWWKTAVFSFAVVLVVVGVGTIGYFVQHDAATAKPGATTATHQSPATAASTSPSSVAGPKALLDKEVTLNRHDAVDVDANPPVVSTGQNGAVGDNDIYFDPAGLPGSLVAHDAEAVFFPATGVTDFYHACSDQFDPSASDRDSGVAGFVSMGSGFCFKTSAGNMAYASVVAVNQPVSSEAAQSVSAHVIVWGKPLP